jgi:hypothetical protein
MELIPAHREELNTRNTPLNTVMIYRKSSIGNGVTPNENQDYYKRFSC